MLLLSPTPWCWWWRWWNSLWSNNPMSGLKLWITNICHQLLSKTFPTFDDMVCKSLSKIVFANRRAMMGQMFLMGQSQMLFWKTVILAWVRFWQIVTTEELCHIQKSDFDILTWYHGLLTFGDQGWDSSLELPFVGHQEHWDRRSRCQVSPCCRGRRGRKGNQGSIKYDLYKHWEIWSRKQMGLLTFNKRLCLEI